MKLDLQWADNVLVAHLHGDMDVMGTARFALGFEPALEQSPRGVVFDFSGVNYIASTGIATIIKIIQQIRHAGGRVHFAALTPRVQAVLHMVNLGSIAPFSATVEEARQAVLAPADSFVPAPQP